MSVHLEGLIRRPLTARAVQRIVYGMGLYAPGSRVVRALAYHINVAEAEHGPRRVEFARLPGGVRLAVTLDDWISSLMYFCGSCARGRRFVYEPETTAFVSRWLRAGDTFLDVGANVGYYTFTGAVLVGPSGCVYALEPQPRLCDLLRATVAKNRLERSVHVDEAAAAAQTGLVALHLSSDPRHSGVASMTRSPFANASASITVPALTLDGLAERERLKAIRLIKIDVEGAELEVLAGAREMLATIRPEALIIEFNRLIAAPAADDWWHSLCGSLEPYGYRPFLMSEEGDLLPCRTAPRWEWGNVCFVAAPYGP